MFIEKNYKVKKLFRISKLTSIFLYSNFQNNLHEANEVFPLINNLCIRQIQIQDNLNDFIKFKNLRFLTIHGFQNENLDIKNILSKLRGLCHQLFGLKFQYFDIRNMEFLSEMQNFIKFTNIQTKILF